MAAASAQWSIGPPDGPMRSHRPNSGRPDPNSKRRCAVTHRAQSLFWESARCRRWWPVRMSAGVDIRRVRRNNGLGAAQSERPQRKLHPRRPGQCLRRTSACAEPAALGGAAGSRDLSNKGPLGPKLETRDKIRIRFIGTWTANRGGGARRGRRVVSGRGSRVAGVGGGNFERIGSALKAAHAAAAAPTSRACGGRR